MSDIMEVGLDAILGVLGILGGVLISIYGVDIRHWISSFNKKDPFIGHWRAKWVITNNGHIVEDDLKIKSCVNGYFRGVGKNEEFGEYTIKGYKTQVSIAFTYSGVGTKEQLLGAVTLDGRGLMTNKLEGVWSNISVKSELHFGTVEMEPMNA